MTDYKNMFADEFNKLVASNEYDRLKEDIDRMFVCYKKEEFEEHYAYAKGRLELIYKCLKRERF